VPRLSQFVLALGLAVVVTSNASADLPKADWADNVNPGRDQLRRGIRALRHIVQQEKLGSRFCGPITELDSMEQELRRLESAYLRGQPVKIKSPPPDTKREKK
jgi:hypothetical protein